MDRTHRILIVDDNLTNIDILEELLDSYEYDSATSGEEAIRMIPVFKPDLILLDIMMPGMNGYEVCKTLKKNNLAGDAKIIMVSAKAMVSERLEGYQAGADDYVVKPFDREELRSKIRVYLRLKTVEEVDRMKTLVLQSLCSDTLNPIKKIINPLKLVLDDATLPEDSRKLITESYLNSANLQQMLEKVVLLNSMRAGSFQLNYIHSDLVEMVKWVVNELSFKTKVKNLSIDLDLLPQAIVRMDTMAIKQVLFSILDNAIRFSPSQGNICIKLSEVDGKYLLSIQDEGESIDYERMTSLTQKIQTLDLDDVNPEWNGLNLSLSKVIISEHGGTISVDSNVGRGQKITIILTTTKVSSGKHIDMKTEVELKRI